MERSCAHAQTKYFPAVLSKLFLLMFQTLSGVSRKHIGTARVNPLGIFRRNMSSLSSENRSIHSDNIQDVHNIPMDVIIRPIPPVLDEQKVQSLMTSIKVRRISIEYWLHLPFKYACSVCDGIAADNFITCDDDFPGWLRYLRCASHRRALDNWRKGGQLLLLFWRLSSICCLSEVKDEIHTSQDN